MGRQLYPGRNAHTNGNRHLDYAARYGYAHTDANPDLYPWDNANADRNLYPWDNTDTNANRDFGARQCRIDRI